MGSWHVDQLEKWTPVLSLSPINTVKESYGRPPRTSSSDRYYVEQTTCVYNSMSTLLGFSKIMFYTNQKLILISNLIICNYCCTSGCGVLFYCNTLTTFIVPVCRYIMPVECWKFQFQKCDHTTTVPDLTRAKARHVSSQSICPICLHLETR